MGTTINIITNIITKMKNLIYTTYTPDTKGTFVNIYKGTKYITVRLSSEWQGVHPIILTYAVEDAQRVLADIEAREYSYRAFAMECHYINDGDYMLTIRSYGIIRPLRIKRERAVR